YLVQFGAECVIPAQSSQKRANESQYDLRTDALDTMNPPDQCEGRSGLIRLPDLHGIDRELMLLYTHRIEQLQVAAARVLLSHQSKRFKLRYLVPASGCQFTHASGQTGHCQPPVGGL